MPHRFVLASLPLLLCGLTACRSPEPLGNLRFSEHADAGAGDAAAPPAFVPAKLLPARFQSTYVLRTPEGAERTEIVTVIWDPEGGALRQSTIHYSAPGEASVERKSEDRLDRGVHLLRGGDGTFLPYPEEGEWAARIGRDLGAWSSLASSLGLQPGATAAPATQDGRPVTRLQLLGGQAGATGTLLLDPARGTLLAVTIAQQRQGDEVSYQAQLGPAPPESLPLPAVPEEARQATERPRSFQRMAEHLRPYLDAPLPGSREAQQAAEREAKRGGKVRPAPVPAPVPQPELQPVEEAD
ncbi:MAG: hypothetical protein RBU45_25165 [Myxococcota bacterium]|jgi:hypothetical protein|nr:hypothetical protein [Myxococcota bacterium]